MHIYAFLMNMTLDKLNYQTTHFSYQKRCL